MLIPLLFLLVRNVPEMTCDEKGQAMLSLCRRLPGRSIEKRRTTNSLTDRTGGAMCNMTLENLPIGHGMTGLVSSATALAHDVDRLRLKPAYAHGERERSQKSQASQPLPMKLENAMFHPSSEVRSTGRERSLVSVVLSTFAWKRMMQMLLESATASVWGGR